MGLYCLMSPGGSPGVTTTGLALALSWPREVMLAECDPAGRRVLPGFLAEKLETPPGPGLLGLALALGRAPEEATDIRLEEFTIPLTDERQARLLHGIRDPRHSLQLARLWQPLAKVLAGSGMDVIADIGRIGGPDTPVGLLTTADLAVMVLRPSLAQVDAAQPRIDALRGRVPLALCLVDSGPYPAAEVSKALSGLPVLAQLPDAPVDARVLSDGSRPRLAFRTSLLMRTAGALGHEMRKTVEERAFHPDAVPLTPSAGAR